MSIWTHVAGVIRIDALVGLGMPFGGPANPDLPERFGSVILWDNIGGDPVSTIVPMGSEGSLNYSIHQNPSESTTAQYAVTIFGDLRDYEDVDEIEAWLNASCKDLIIRDACISIEIEGRDKIILTYGEDSFKRLSVSNG